MSEIDIPEKWETTYLSKIVRIIRGVTYSKSEALIEPEKGFYPVLRANNIQNGKICFNDLVFVPENRILEIQKVQRDDIIVAMSSGSRSLVGKTAHAATNWEGSFGAFCGLLRPLDAITKKYVFWFTCSSLYRGKISDLAAGVNINNLKPSHFDEIIIPFPTLAEQKEIASRLDNLLKQVDTIKARLDAIPVILKRFRHSVLSAAVSGELTKEWRGEERKLTQFALKKQFLVLREYPVAIPSNWMIHSFTDVCNIASNLVDPVEFQDYPHIAPDNIEKEVGKLIGYNTIKKDKVFSPKHKFFKGQIIYSKIRPYLSKAILIDFDGLCSADMYPLSSLINVKYLYYYILSPIFVDFASTAGDRSVLPKINQKELSQIPVPVPSIEEQQEIVKRVEQLFSFADKIEQQVKAAQMRVKHLTSSILTKAFSGELTTEWREQNPELISGENSAEALLERIKEGKENSLKPKIKKHTIVKNTTGIKMQKKQKTNKKPILEVLKIAKKPLKSQELLSQAGYPNDAPTEELEQFFLDIREQIKAGTIARKRQGNSDIFTLIK